MMDFKVNNKTDRILAAALACFKQYGFKRTSMMDIAKHADVSRPALYLLFKNKTDIFRSLSRHFHEQTLNSAKDALLIEDEICAQISQALIKRKVPHYALANDSLHGPELFDVNMSTAADINKSANEQFLKLLTEVLERAVQDALLILPDNVSINDLATMINAGAFGLKQTAQDIEHYKTLLEKLAHTMLISMIPK